MEDPLLVHLSLPGLLATSGCEVKALGHAGWGIRTRGGAFGREMHLTLQ